MGSESIVMKKEDGIVMVIIHREEALNSLNERYS